MMKTIAGVIFAAGLGLAGCGGTESQTNGPTKTSAAPAAATAAAGVSTGVRCSNKDWRDIFWSDATYTVQVGALTCTCFQLETLEGVESNFITLDYEFTCDTR
jgi:hypothetical protein